MVYNKAADEYRRFLYSMFLVWVGKSKTCVLEISLSSFTCGLHEIKRGCGGGDVFMGRGQNNSNLTFTIKTG